MEWEFHSQLNEPRFMAAGLPSPGNINKSLLISGGRNPETKQLLDSIEVFYLESSTTWTKTNLTLPRPDAGHDMRFLNKHSLMLVHSKIETGQNGVFIMNKE